MFVQYVIVLLLISGVLVIDSCYYDLNSGMCRDTDCRQFGGYCQSSLQQTTNTVICKCIHNPIELCDPKPDSLGNCRDLGCQKNGGKCEKVGEICKCKKCEELNLCSSQSGQCVSSGCKELGKCCNRYIDPKDGIEKCKCQNCILPEQSCQMTSKGCIDVLGKCTNQKGCCKSYQDQGLLKCRCQKCPQKLCLSYKQNCFDNGCSSLKKCCLTIPKLDLAGNAICQCGDCPRPECQLMTDGTCRNNNCTKPGASCKLIVENNIKKCYCLDCILPQPQACQLMTDGTCRNNNCTKPGECCKLIVENNVKKCECLNCIFPQPCQMMADGTCKDNGLCGKPTCCQPIVENGVKKCKCTPCSPQPPACQLMKNGSCQDNSCRKTSDNLNCCQPSLQFGKKTCKCLNCPNCIATWTGQCINNGCGPFLQSGIGEQNAEQRAFPIDTPPKSCCVTYYNPNEGTYSCRCRTPSTQIQCFQAYLDPIPKGQLTPEIQIASRFEDKV